MSWMTIAHMWGGDVGWGWMTLTMILTVLFWGAIAFGVVWLVRGASGGSSASTTTPVETPNAMEILQRRFAEGSITVDEYRTRRAILRGEDLDPSGLKGAGA